MGTPAALHDMAAKTRTGTSGWAMANQYVIFPREPSYPVRLPDGELQSDIGGQRSHPRFERVEQQR